MAAFPRPICSGTLPCIYILFFFALLSSNVAAFAPTLSRFSSSQCFHHVNKYQAHKLLLQVPRCTRARLSNGALQTRAEEGIRAATDKDLDTIREMVTKENMNFLFLNPADFLIAEADDEIVGIGQIRSLGKSFELASLVVREDMRGQGIGTALVEELLARHKKKHEGDNAEKRPPDILLLTLQLPPSFYSRLGIQKMPLNMGSRSDANGGTPRVCFW
uniref:Acetyltransferse n=1 Tax=Guillardia theta TaxID=55529 RepID=A0PCY5_GUITH|nr:acetyltransferse [Guillardia theta]